MKNVRLLFLLLVAFALVRSANATDYYFSNDGDDGNTGTSPAQAWETASKLQTTINSASSGDVIYLERGSVWENAAISLSSKTGLTLTAYGSGEKPVLSGYKTLTSPTNNYDNTYTYSGQGIPNVYRMYIDDQNDADPWYACNLNFLLIDGESYDMARHPNGANYYDAEDVDESGSMRSWFTETDISWSDGQWTNAQIKIFPEHWIPEDIRISSYSGNTFYLETSDWNSLLNLSKDTMQYSTGIKYYIFNHENALDQEGEWCWDRSNQAITVYSTSNLANSTVKQTFLDSVINVSSCTNVRISNIEFMGAIKHTMKMVNSSNIDVDSCTFRYTPIYAAYVDNNTSISFQYDSIFDATSSGILFRSNNGETAKHCYGKNIGVSEGIGGDRGNESYRFIHSDRRDGTFTCEYNQVDSFGYVAYSIYHYQPGTIGDASIQFNYAANGPMLLTDGAPFYNTSDISSSLKEIKHNIVENVYRNTGMSWDGSTLSMAYYLDVYCQNFQVDSNTVVNSQYGIYLNGTDYNYIRYNHIGKVSETGMVAKASGFGHAGSATTYCDFYNNVSVASGTAATGSEYYYYTTFSGGGNDFNYNDYYNPFESTDESIGRYSNWTLYPTSLSSWNSISGWEGNSTYNQNNYQYDSGRGASEDETVKVLWNYSGSTRTVDLHDCEFVDLDGDTVTGSINIAPYYSDILFYIDGDSLFNIQEGNYGSPAVWDSTYTLTISTNGQGSVSPGSGSYAADTTLSLTATPSAGYEFTGWSGDTTATSNPLSVVMWKNKGLTATFTDTTSSPPASDTIAFWRFENNADDETGVHDATLYGSPTYYTPAAEGSYALNLDGSGRYANCDTITLGDSFSISGHVLIWGSSGTRTIFSTTTTSALDGLVGYVNLGTGVFSLGTGDGSSSATATSTTGNHSSGSWVKFEYIVDCSANTCEIYIDDSDESSSTTIDGGFTDGKTFYIGQESSGANDTRLWGRVDGLLIVGEGSGPVNPTVTISATDATATEASETTGTYRVSRGSETSGNLTVNFSVSGTATLNTDYTLSSSSSVTISDGNSYADITLTPDDDSDVEGSETAIITLSSGTGYTVGSPSAATVTITDDDFPVVTITATDATATEASETTGTYRISRGAETSGNLTVNLGTPTGTATFNTDYILSSSGTVTITNGNTYADITLTPDDDASVEGSETAILSVTSGTGYTVGSPSSATITITDNDTATESDTIAYWRFENNADDETGVHDGTVNGSYSYESSSPAEGTYRLSLDGTGCYVNCDTITLGNTFTISGYYLIWGTSGTRALFGTTTSSSPDGILATVNLSTGVLSLITGDGSSSATATSTTGNHSSGSWVKFEYIVDRTANTCEIYIDDSDESSSTTIVGDFMDGKTFYIGQDSSGGSRIWGRVDAILILGEGGSTGGGESSIDTIAKINFTATGYTETGWTNIVGSTFNESLGDGVYISTNYGFSAGTAGEPSTVFPSNVGSTYNFMMNTNNDPAYITVSGLDTASAVTYRFSFFESRDDGSASGDRTTTYTIGGESVGTNPVGNTSTVLTIDEVEADASGEVEITVTKITNQYGYINALIIEEVTGSGESRAVLEPGQNLGNTLSAIEYYPVPVSDRLNLKNVPSRSLISVYDMVGHKVMEQRSGLGTDLQLNVSHLKSGIYLFRIIDDTSSVMKNFKIVKK